MACSRVGKVLEDNDDGASTQVFFLFDSGGLNRVRRAAAAASSDGTFSLAVRSIIKFLAGVVRQSPSFS